MRARDRGKALAGKSTLNRMELTKEAALDAEGKKDRYKKIEMNGAAVERLKATPGALFACECSRGQLARSGAQGRYPGICRDKGLPLNAPGTKLRFAADDGTAGGFVVWKKDGMRACYGCRCKKTINRAKPTQLGDGQPRPSLPVLATMGSGTLFNLPQMLLSAFIFLPTESSEEPNHLALFGKNVLLRG